MCVVRHLDLQQLAVDELPQVVLAERDEVVPGVGTGLVARDVGHAWSMGHGEREGSKASGVPRVGPRECVGLGVGSPVPDGKRGVQGQRADRRF